jgi:hypothetical protein
MKKPRIPPPGLRLRSALLVGMVFFCCVCCSSQPDERVPSYPEFRRLAFKELTALRKEKAAKIEEWLTEQQGLLRGGRVRSRLIEFFQKLRKAAGGRISRKDFLLLNRAVEEFFVYELGTFYDLLFIDADKTVFYSVKMEDDFGSSLTAGRYADTRLAEAVRGSPRKPLFVDFQYYGPSDEAAAFHVLPVLENGRYQGAIALQLSINHLNQLLTDREGLGRTGEAYLVNKAHLMLTKSRFINADTVLTKKIDTRAVRSRSGTSGEKVITDYRGVRVLSTFSALSVGSATWRIIVEKDESEVVTDYYRRYSSTLYPLLARAAAAQTAAAAQRTERGASPEPGAGRVDVSELVRAGRRRQLHTPGLATCTGVAAYTPSGDFSYMAHLSPVDESYSLPPGERGRLSEKSTDLVSLLLRRIRYFEIKPCHLGRLRFLVAATHTNSLRGIIERLVDAGVHLHQIKAGILEGADSLSLFYDVPRHALTGIGRTDGGGEKRAVDFEALPNLGSLAARLKP